MNQTLYDCARNGDHSAMRNFLASPTINVNFEHQEHRGATALHAACEKGDKQMAEMLVSARANMWALALERYSNDKYETPIEVAWKREHHELVRHLFALRLPRESLPPPHVLDSLVSKDEAVEIIQLLIQQLKTASSIDVKRQFLEDIWQRISSDPKFHTPKLVACIIKNRTRGLNMGHESIYWGLSDEISIESNLVRGSTSQDASYIPHSVHVLTWVLGSLRFGNTF